jgi:5'-phosphate synthase pdxT subunit
VIPVIGILALQGDFQAHGRVLARVGGEAREVRTPRDLEGIDGLVIPGGESTVIAAGIEREGLAAPIRDLVKAGTPLLGTCAGLILAGRDHLGLIDLQARRNAFGRQVRSFEADLDIAGLAGGPLRAVFIRAPWIESAGEGVELLAHVDGHPVAARQGHVTVVAFHPELSGDFRLHEQWLAAVRDRPHGSQREPVADDVLGHHA